MSHMLRMEYSFPENYKNDDGICYIFFSLSRKVCLTKIRLLCFQENRFPSQYKSARCLSKWQRTRKPSKSQSMDQGNHAPSRVSWWFIFQNMPSKTFFPFNVFIRTHLPLFFFFGIYHPKWSIYFTLKLTYFYYLQFARKKLKVKLKLKLKSRKKSYIRNFLKVEKKAFKIC